VIGASKICQGLGLFAVEPILKDELITTYLGEVIYKNLTVKKLKTRA
jgi:SET domain-containing protein